MAWVIDTCLLIDVAEADPHFGTASVELLDAYRAKGLVLCPISYIELAPVFEGDRTAQNIFLRNLLATFEEPWCSLDTIAAHEGWHRYVKAKRKGALPKKPIADILIGAFSSRFDGLLTRNHSDFRTLYPDLQIATPPASKA